MEGPISFWGYKEQESSLILPEHDDDDDDDDDGDEKDDTSRACGGLGGESVGGGLLEKPEGKRLHGSPSVG
jgi:hypothetical protein